MTDTSDVRHAVYSMGYRQTMRTQMTSHNAISDQVLKCLFSECSIRIWINLKVRKNITSTHKTGNGLVLPIRVLDKFILVNASLLYNMIRILDKFILVNASLLYNMIRILDKFILVNASLLDNMIRILDKFILVNASLLYNMIRILD